MRNILSLCFLFIWTTITVDAQTVIRGPYLQKGNSNAVTVQWRTDASTQSIVNYGTSVNNLNQSVNVQSLSVDHSLEITGLSPETKYYYNIANNNGILVAATSDQYFQSHPLIGSSDPYRFWVLGDCGTGTANAEAVRDAYYGYVGGDHTDGILYLGDNAYNSGTDTEYQGAIFEMYDEKLKNTIAWSCLGNHDGFTADSDTQTGPYYDIFTFPTNGESGGTASGTEAYYSFDYGNVHFISLESYETDRSVGGAMYNWAESDIQNTTQDWIVAIWHHPPYTKGSHNSDTETPLIQMRENFLPMLEANGVDLIMSGHSHSYERSYYINGHYGSSGTFNSNTMTVGANGDGDGQIGGNGAYQRVTDEGTVYITAGSSGKITGNGSLNHPAMHYSVKELGSCVIEVDGDQMDVKFIRETGATEDFFTIQKTVPITGIDLANYNSTCGIDNVSGVLELSGLTYDYDDQVFYGVEDNTKLHEIGLDGNVNQTYTLSGYQDTEGIVYLGNDQFGITEERKREVVIVTINNNTPSTITYNSNNVIAFNDSGQGQNNGFEGLAYDSANDILYIAKEGDANISAAIFELANPLGQQGNTVNATPAFTSLPNCPSFDAAGLAWTPANTLLVITEQCDIVYELDPANGAILSQKTISGFSFPEAITMVNDNEIWVGGEANQLAQFVIPGSSCDDGNVNTVNDVYDSSCGCAGTPSSFCPNLNLFVGDSCNDGDPTTINDIVDNNCNCVGTPDPNYCANLGLYIGDSCNDGNPNTINDTVNSNCNCVGTVPVTGIDLTNFSSTCGIDNISSVLELSGLTFDYDDQVFYGIEDNTTLHEIAFDGTINNTYTLSGYQDTEGIVYLGGNQFAIAEERRREVVIVTITNNTPSTINYNTNNVISFNDSGQGQNNGFEGLAYDSANDILYIAKEGDANISAAIFELANPLGQQGNTVNATAAFTSLPNCPSFDAAGLAWTPANTLLVITEQCDIVYELDPANGNIISQKTISGFAFPEAITMVNDNELWVGGEANQFQQFVIPGSSCDDGNANTFNDIYDSSCGCAGTPDPNYCPNLNLNIGDACNDGDPTTLNDTVNSNCVCVGTPDPNYCPNLGLYIGNSCNDGDPTTINDTVNNNCNCVGTPDPNYCVNLGLYIGDACNDGDPNTTNDTVNSSCNCVGTPPVGCNGQFPETESFETGLGDWTQGTDDDLDWIRDSGGTPSNGTGPSTGSDGSWYMYVESSSPNFPGKTASLVSECFNVATTGGGQITFDYYMNGTVTNHELEFQVSTDNQNTWTTLWNNVGSDGSVWTEVSINLDAYVNTDVNFRFFGTTGSSWSGDIAIDDINMFVTSGTDCPLLGLDFGDPCDDGNVGTINDAVNTNCVCVGTPDPNYCANLGLFIGDSCNDGDPNTTNDTVNSTCNCVGTPIACNGQFPEVESFETGLGDWTQGTDDDIDWTRDSGGTPSNGTGPSTGSDGSWYMYVESSSPNFPGKTASLVSECFNVNTTGGGQITFDYYMNGTVTNHELEFQVSTDGQNTWTTLWNNIGSDGSVWTPVNVNLDVYMNTSVYFRFFGTTGSSWSGDIAIDNINMTTTDGVDCPALGLNIGDPCDDGNATTINDAVNANCVCVGSTDPNYCANLGLFIGDSCNDNDPTTINDVVNNNCNCVGTPDPNYCTNLGLYIGDACNDGDPNTTNDTVNSSCNCVGTPPVGCNGQFPEVESFETGLGDWTQGTDDDLNWTRDSGGTPSSGTGPTTGSDGSWYMYVESSSPNFPGKTASLVSECFNVATTGGGEITFDYHMQGTVSNNQLEFQVSTDDGNSWTTLWNNIGSVGSTWNSVYLDISAYVNIDVYFRFFGTTGSSWSGDIAIDNINMQVNGNNSFCANLGLFIGDPCDDNDPNTINDTVNSACVCAGTPGGNSVDLTNFNSGCGVSTLGINNLSGVTYSPVTNTLYGITNFPTSVVEIDLDGNILRTITLNGSFNDTEGIVHLSGNQFFVAEERDRRATLITIDANTTTITYPGNGAIVFNDSGSGDNFGFEGLAYDAVNDVLFIGREGDSDNDNAGTEPKVYKVDNPLSQLGNLVTPVEAFTTLPTCNNFDIGGLAFTSAGSLLLMSDNCSTIYELDPNTGAEYSVMTISGFTQPEGVTIINDNELWVVGEADQIEQYVIPGTTCQVGCYVGATWDNNCNCTGGTIIDGDGDGECASEDPDDTDPCIPDSNDPLCGGGGTVCTTLLDNDFESGYQGWADGGSDCRRSINDAVYANSGSYCVRLRDNTNSSVVTSPTLNSTNCDIMELTFSFIAANMEPNEDFWLQISSNNGASWTTIESWASGVEFQNGVREFETIQIAPPLNTTTKIRFRCDASNNGDYIYIDDVFLEKCILTNVTDGGVEGLSADDATEVDLDFLEMEVEEREGSAEQSVKIYPNPSKRGTEMFITLSQSEKVLGFDVMNLTGQRVLRQQWNSDLTTMKIPVSMLNNGTYLLRLQTSDGIITKKFIILE